MKGLKYVSKKFYSKFSINRNKKFAINVLFAMRARAKMTLITYYAVLFLRFYLPKFALHDVRKCEEATANGHLQDITPKIGVQKDQINSPICLGGYVEA